MSTADPQVAAAMRNVAAARKTTFPWTRDKPYPQPYHAFSPEHRQWIQCPASPAPKPTSATTSPSKLAVLTWNIDFGRALSQARMAAVIVYLGNFLKTTVPPSIPTVILLQEMLETDLGLLQSTPWIQQNFHLTDLTASFWESGYYGTCTLVDKRLSIKQVSRLHFAATKFERDALFVDVVLPPSVGNKAKDGRVVRICNTHLESLVSNPPLRPHQLAATAPYLHSPDIHASILGGDMNAIQPFDRTLHTANKLKDAYLELGGKEDTDAGYTWGQQAQRLQRETYGCSRMDKIFFCGGVQVKGVRRFGADVQVEKKEDQERLLKDGLEAAWATDHLGVWADFEVVA